ncbi:MAG: WbqC family protein [Pseudomonadota bacterium]
MREHLVAIHQPNFFPWLGYFDKLRRADSFIFLDDVQFPKTGGAWTNRVTILQQQKAHWLTAPIDRKYHGLRNVNAMHFAATDWREAALRQLQAAYQKAPFAQEVFALITPLLMNPTTNIADYNIHAVTQLCAALGLSTRLQRSSALAIEGVATERLIALTKAVGGTQYLCGGGADGYQQDALFAQAGLGLVYQQFTPTPYPQKNTPEFVGGLSIIDALMFHGTTTLQGMLACQKQ